MGGGEHHEPFKVPHWTTHSHYRSAPELADYEQRLARLGLRDPWIRNYWPNFNTAYSDSQKTGLRGGISFIFRLLRPGLIPGATFAGTIIALEEMYSYIKYGHTSWGGHWGDHHH